MFAVVVNSLWTVANNLLINRPNPIVEQATVPIPRWRRWGSAFISVLSRVGLPLLNNTVLPESVYDYVNTMLGNQTPRRPHDRHPIRREHEHGINRLSRPDFRRRSNRRQRPIIHMTNPTFNITVQRP